jgi:hypothetical protein
MTNIYFSFNEFGDKGTSSLADALKVNTSIKIITFLHSKIGDDGASALAEALKVNTTLSAIDLDYNAKSQVQSNRRRR